MRKKTFYFLIDTSESMRGARGDAVNVAMREFVEQVIPAALDQKDVELNISFAVLTFSTDFYDTSNLNLDWVIPKTNIEEEWEWQDIEPERFSGLAPIGEAVTKVIEDILYGCFGEPDPETVAPTILLISDGNFDESEFEEALKYADKDSENYCPDYARADRIAIGIQTNDYGRALLEKFSRLSRTKEAAGIKKYYDFSNDSLEQFCVLLCNLLKSYNTGLSL